MCANELKGRYVTTLEAMLAAYEKCPPAVRAALREAKADWVPQPALTAYRRALRAGLWPSEAERRTVAMIERWDREETEEHWYRMHRMLDKGIDYCAQIRRKKNA